MDDAEREGRTAGSVLSRREGWRLSSGAGLDLDNVKGAWKRWSSRGGGGVRAGICEAPRVASGGAGGSRREGRK